MNKEDLFYCYSGKLKSFLVYQNDIKYLHKGRNFKSERDFWVFARDEKLKSALDQWSINKINK
ncbi:hypothetical protein [Priestia aryabhattai]|uniref:hypothetical protein n=1 Tax=Priestia aryabhattai TaxID=412384 RepID=UPI0015F76399|nr:hypothetical protein [Priestia aryabhattai]